MSMMTTNFENYRETELQSFLERPKLFFSKKKTNLYFFQGVEYWV